MLNFLQNSVYKHIKRYTSTSRSAMDAANLKTHELDFHPLGTSYADGEMIFREGDWCDALYVVQGGQVRITSIQPSGEEVEITVAGPGEVFGITSLFDNLPRCASAVALGPANVLKLDRNRIVKAVHKDPSLVFFILKSVSARTRKLVSDITELKTSCQINDPGSSDKSWGQSSHLR
jgi:CRP-like cAMP-binding protein